ncbi:NAD-dependent epimerase/dehydratase family protein [Microbulbifer sp. SAOS-129_SWC]|uniref:NAD-dependent epimerase/dehydratase family protein n=1 Tax=Microbulbifer sp. SAOS-129_SWC TaxID=3145235 RepID=UPI003217C24F
MGKRALVIGASGLVGRALTQQLAAADWIDEVVTLTRRPLAPAAPYPHQDKVRNHVVDFDELERDPALFRGDLLYSCLGTTKRAAGSLAAQRRVDVDYQLQAARLAAQQGVAHYLLVSSSGANPDSRSAYLRMKGELEQQVLQLPFARISIFRPSLLLGKRDQWRPAEWLGSWLLPLLCTLPGLRRYRPIAAAQVAAKMVSVSAQDGPAVQSFTLDELFHSEG